MYLNIGVDGVVCSWSISESANNIEIYGTLVIIIKLTLSSPSVTWPMDYSRNVSYGDFCTHNSKWNLYMVSVAQMVYVSGHR